MINSCTFLVMHMALVIEQRFTQSFTFLSNKLMPGI